MTAGRRQRALAQVGAAAALGLLVLATIAYADPWPLARELWLLRATGWTACGALLLSLSMTPLSRLAELLPTRRGRSPRRAAWAAYRRAFGVASAVLAMVHAGLALGTYLRDSWATLLHWPYLRSGLVAVSVLAALLLTSFPGLVKALRLGAWKELHRLAWVAAALVLHHLLLSPFADRRTVLAVFGTWLAVAGLRLLPRTGRRPVAGEPGATARVEP
ncbi:MAG: ferric reductase-like transmembrane domain-containing protein [Holophagales bacterium]|nr:ferric reductase-like transmembrane domain-containing protein [Holophagales bacterium]